LTFGFLTAGPLSGYLSDRYGARVFATAGMLGTAVAFALLEMLPIDFSYAAFAGILLLMGLAMGCFASPNRAAVMNSLPPQHRGAGGGMNQTFQNSAQVLSIGIFFTLMILGLSATLPKTLAHGLVSHGVPAADATRISHLPPVSVLFAAFLGYNPAKELIGPHVLAHIPAHDAATISGRSFFPNLIASPFRGGLHEAFAFAIVACLIAAAASWSRGRRYVAAETYPPRGSGAPAPPARPRGSTPEPGHDGVAVVRLRHDEPDG
jgi:MFS family permease